MNLSPAEWAVKLLPQAHRWARDLGKQMNYKDLEELESVATLALWEALCDKSQYDTTDPTKYCHTCVRNRTRNKVRDETRLDRFRNQVL